MQKYQGNSTNAPRETFINDQRHMLAYINPFEEDLLRNYGGTGQAGPGGVPAFPPRSSRDRAGMSRSTSSSSGATTASSSAAQSQAASNASKGGYGAMSNDRQSNDNDRVGSSAQQASAATRNAAIQSQAATNQAASQAATQAAASRNPAREIALAQPNAQAQSAMDRFGSRANNPQTVSEILMAQQSLRSLAPPPSIQSMTKTAELGFAIPGAVTTDAGPQPYSMGTFVAPKSPLSDLEFDEDYQDAKSQLEAAGYVVDENGIVRTTTGESVGPLSEVVNFGRANPSSGGAAEIAAAAPGTVFPKLDVAPGTVDQVVAPPVAPPVSKAGPPVKKGTALDAEREIALAGGFTFFRSSDGKFYTTDPNAPQALQEALARRSVPYTPESHPDAFNANGEPRKGFLGFMGRDDFADGGGSGASGSTFSGGITALYGNALGIRPVGVTDEQWGQIKADRKAMADAKMGWASQRPDFSKYPGTGFPDPAQSTDGFGGDSYQGGGDNQVAAPAPEPIIDPCPEGYVLKEGACVLDTSTTIPGFPSLTPPLPQGPTVVGNPGYTPIGGGVAPRLNPYPQQMPIMAPPPGLAGAQVGEAGILDLLRAANR
jgi:hypothetical protein